MLISFQLKGLSFLFCQYLYQIVFQYVFSIVQFTEFPLLHLSSIVVYKLKL